MPPVAGCLVKSPRVSGQQRLQHLRRRSLLHFQEQMEVVRHQNVGVEVKRITLSHHRQTVEKRFVVAVLKKYLAPVVASGHHVIEQSLCMDSGMSGHKALISKLVDLGKSDTVMTDTLFDGERRNVARKSFGGKRGRRCEEESGGGECNNDTVDHDDNPPRLVWTDNPQMTWHCCEHWRKAHVRLS